jgi:hypothetical protein
LAEFLYVRAEKPSLLAVNAFDVSARANDLEVLAFFNALARAGIDVNDVAVGKHTLFLLLNGADDLGHFGQALEPDVTGAEKGGSACNLLRGFLWRRDDVGRGGRCLRVGRECRDEQQRQKENYFRESEPCHV